MKKILSLLCVCALLMSLCACGEKSTGDVESNSPKFNIGGSRDKDDSSESQEPTDSSKEQEPADSSVEPEMNVPTKPEDNKQDEVVSDGDVSYEIKWAGFSRIGDAVDNEWLFRAIVQNTGDVPMFCNTCAADIETESGELVGKMEYMNFEPCIVMPGDYAYMTATEYFRDYTGDELLSATPRFDIEKSIRPAVQYEVSDLKVSKDDYGAIHILGYVTNTTSEDEDNMKLVFTLFSSEGYLFTDTSYVSETVKAGEKVSFDETIYPDWYDCDVNDVSDLFCIGIPAFEYNY